MASRHKQHTFEGLTKPKDAFGGSLLRSHPKTRRPLDSKLPTHLVLRANKSTMRRPGTLHRVDQQVRKTCRRHGVKLYEYANVGNHLHLLLKIRNRPSWSAFIRELTGRIAQIASHAQGGASTDGTAADNATKRFWANRPFTRIVRGWQKAYRLAKEYVRLNILEADGMIKRSETKTLKDLRMIWEDN